MREIKFRAWDSVNVMMLFHNSKYLSKSQWFKMCEGRGIIDFEQYTGLKDKNGKEIYEGDILAPINYLSHDIKKPFPSEESTGKGEVYFIPHGGFRCRWADIEQSDNIESWAEIIGNIHENKDLL